MLTMNRPEKLNALNTELTQALLDALQAADGDPAVRVIVLTGAGRGFCAGADVTEFKHLTADNPRDIAARGDLTMRLHARLHADRQAGDLRHQRLRHGRRRGLALAGDMAVMAADARLGYPEVKRGACRRWCWPTWSASSARKAAFELVTLGEPVTAERALALGLVNRAVPDERLMEETLAHRRARWRRAARTRCSPPSACSTASPPCALLPALEVARDANVIMRGYGARSTV